MKENDCRRGGITDGGEHGEEKRGRKIYVEIGGGRARGMQNRGANLAPHQRRNGNERSGAVSAFLGRPTGRQTDDIVLCPSTPFHVREKGKIGESERRRGAV